jgi:ATP synthase subunit 6
LMLYISLSLGLGIFLIGINKHGLNFFWLFLPTCPTFLIPLLIIIEISSYIIRTFSLAIRLSANIMAGHTLMFVISSFLLKIMSFGIFFWFLSLILICLILMLELGVAILQAYVFTILILIYLNDSLKGPQH